MPTCAASARHCLFEKCQRAPRAHVIRFYEERRRALGALVRGQQDKAVSAAKATVHVDNDPT
ncbi:hypothetical protein J6590_092445 [Homalodisca vitripennis]|nr:hypothetical protein J6590_092445 [Homalodisca vitripennis]